MLRYQKNSFRSAHTILFSFPEPDKLEKPGEVSISELTPEIAALYKQYTDAGYFVSLDYWDKYESDGAEQHGFNFVVNWRDSIKQAIADRRPAV